MSPLWNNGMMEFWNVGFKVEDIHLILNALGDAARLSTTHLSHFFNTHYSSIPVFQYSNWELYQMALRWDFISQLVTQRG